MASSTSSTARPVIGVCNPSSDPTPCDAHLRQLADRGHQQLYFEHVMQASEGSDLDFLFGGRGMTVARDSH
jgi:dihydroxyacid dehydratase/phosphogluconate dehydratase